MWTTVSKLENRVMCISQFTFFDKIWSYTKILFQVIIINTQHLDMLCVILNEGDMMLI